MFGFIKKAAKSVVNVAKVVTKVTKPIATGVAIVYPPAAPIAAGVFVADKALNAVQPATPKRVSAAVKVAAAQNPSAPRGLLTKAVHKKMAEQRAAGQRIIANTALLASKGDVNAARGMTLITKRAAARREAARWRLRNGRIVRVA